MSLALFRERGEGPPKRHDSTVCESVTFLTANGLRRSICRLEADFRDLRSPNDACRSTMSPICVRVFVYHRATNSHWGEDAMDAAFVVGAPLAMACLLGSCLVGGAGCAMAGREFVGWPVWTRIIASLCGALAGFCVSATATSWWEFAELTALVAVLLACSVTDLARRIIPNSLVAVAIMARCVYLWLKATFPGTGSMWSSDALEELEISLLGGATVLFVLVATRALWIRVRGSPRQSLGGGDAKLLSACGVYLGPIGGMACVALSCLLALACCLGAWAIGQICGVRGPFPKAFPLAPLVLASIVILTAYRAF